MTRDWFFAGHAPMPKTRRKSNRLNDNDREEWINNDTGLYEWWQRSRKGITTFIRENRAELDRLIYAMLNEGPTDREARQVRASTDFANDLRTML